MTLTDTILALSSSPDPSGPRALLRLSGPHAHTLATLISNLPTYAPPGHHPITLLDPKLPAAALLFHAPRSFTGEHTAELHLPNSPGLLRHLTDHLLTAARTHNLPARPANPGEFSARAFFNQKIDLTQAEGIAATINAQNQTQLRAAASLRTGHLHAWIHTVAEKVATLLALLEAGIDFVDEEDVHSIAPIDLATQLEQIDLGIHDQLAGAVRLDRLDQLPTVAFVGKPNVGKSSLVNALAGLSRSIVSPIAGTTRDVLPVTMTTPLGAVRLLDLPGTESPTDELRRMMMASRDLALGEADLIVEVIAHPTEALSSFAEPADYPARCVVVQNMADLLPADLVRCSDEESENWRGAWQLVSAKTGLRLDLLRDFLAGIVLDNRTVSTFYLSLNQRHRRLLQDAREPINRAIGLAASEELDHLSHPELLAADLRTALDLLGQITGTISPDDILGKIFSTFCIGK